MNKKIIADFFDECAPTWDENMLYSEAVINAILDGAEITEGVNVLDVACGTGVLFPFYLERGVASITAVDISPEMVKIAAGKHPGKNIRVICADAEEGHFEGPFDRIVVYNAFPHFTNPERLIENLVSCLAEGGTLTVAHGMSKQSIDKRHRRAARKVSRELPEAEELAELFACHLQVTLCVSDGEMYQVSGRRV
ncbi:MAG: class I SAM-dependent methyltransferase [Lachnospiraceae bacterium]